MNDLSKCIDVYSHVLSDCEVYIKHIQVEIGTFHVSYFHQSQNNCTRQVPNGLHAIKVLIFSLSYRNYEFLP